MSGNQFCPTDLHHSIKEITRERRASSCPYAFPVTDLRLKKQAIDGG
jgi:hypothetical protein